MYVSKRVKYWISITQTTKCETKFFSLLKWDQKISNVVHFCASLGFCGCPILYHCIFSKYFFPVHNIVTRILFTLWIYGSLIFSCRLTMDISVSQDTHIWGKWTGYRLAINIGSPWHKSLSNYSEKMIIENLPVKSKYTS